jgi:electron transfer flavoprotein beta subunit
VNLFVCTKHVPDTAGTIKLTEETHLDDTVNFVINPHDECALEQALQLRDQIGGGSEVMPALGRLLSATAAPEARA